MTPRVDAPRPRWTLRVIALAIVLVGVLPVFVLGLLAVERSRQLQTEAAAEQVVRIRDLLTEGHEVWLAAAQDGLQLLEWRLRDASLAECRQVLDEAMATTAGFDVFTLFGPKGDLLCTTAEVRGPLNVGDREYFRRAVTSRQFVVGDYMIGRVSGEPSMPMALPVIDREGRLAAVLVAGKQADWFHKHSLNYASLPQSATVTLIDGAGRAFVRSSGDTPPGQQLADQGLRDITLTMREGVIERRDPAGTPTFAAFAPIPGVKDQPLLILEVPTASLLHPVITDFLLWGSGVAAVAAAAALFALFLLDRAVTQPLRRLSLGLERVAQGDHDVVFASRSRVRELALLDSQANAMTAAVRAWAAEARQREQALEDANRDLEDFASIASHDLQEPLRKISSFGTLLRRRFGDQLPQEGHDYIAYMVDGAARLQGLVDELLEYSRIGHAAHAISAVSLNDLVVEVLADLDGRIAEIGARVEVAPDLPVVPFDRGRLRQILQNLLSNALKYRHPERPLVVTITGAGVGADGAPGAWLRVADNGRGFPAARADELFLPFRRLVSRQDVPGTGMGLAICRKIAQAFGGLIHATGKEGEGAAFVIEFDPLATLPE